MNKTPTYSQVKAAYGSYLCGYVVLADSVRYLVQLDSYYAILSNQLILNEYYGKRYNDRKIALGDMISLKDRIDAIEKRFNKDHYQVVTVSQYADHPDDYYLSKFILFDLDTKAYYLKYMNHQTQCTGSMGKFLSLDEALSKFS